MSDFHNCTAGEPVECFGGPMDGGIVLESEIVDGKLAKGFVKRNSQGIGTFFTWDWVGTGEPSRQTAEYQVGEDLKLRHVRTRNT